MSDYENFDEEIVNITFEIDSPDPDNDFESVGESQPLKESKRWQDPETRLLIELYRKCIPQVGPTKKFKKKEAIWAFIQAELLLKEHNFTIKQVKNKFTQLVRSYKATIDNNKKTGRRKRTCAFFKELHEIFGERSSVNPPFVLTSSEMTESSALVEDDFLIQSPSATISSRSGSISSLSNVSSSPVPSSGAASVSPANDSQSSVNHMSPVSHPINVTTAPVKAADFKKSHDRRKKNTLADEVRALKEVKKDFYNEKLKLYKDFNEKRLQLLAELVKQPASSSNNTVRETDE